jgi:predicted lactoylglutathione lyase
VSVPAKVSFVTLAVRDLPRMWEFFRQFGWPEGKDNNEHHVAFQCGGAVLGLYSAHHYEPQFGPPPPPGAFKGFTLAINLESAGEVDRVHETLRSADGVRDLDDAPADLGYGRGFSFRDPEDNVWDVVWVDGTSFDARGGLIFP